MGVQISNLPNIVTPTLSDVFPVVQGGVTYKETFTQLASLFGLSGANTNITSMTGLTGVLQAPTFINDVSGNHILGFSQTATAVNYISIYNAATGGSPSLVAFGTDPNISTTIVNKGTGSFILYSTNPSPVIFYSGTAYQHATAFTFANTANIVSVNFPDAAGTVAFTGTLVAGNLVKASTAYTVVDQGFAMKSVAGAAAAGGSAAQSFTDAFCTTGSNVIGNWNTQANPVSVLKIVPGAGSFVVTSSGDAGVGTFNYIITK